MSHDVYTLHPPPLSENGTRWKNLLGAGTGLACAELATQQSGLVLVVTSDPLTAAHLEAEVRFFGGDALPVLHLPDWELLPYDLYAPHPDIVSERLATLYRLPTLQRGVLIAPVTTLMQRLPPRDYLEQHALLLRAGDTLPLDALRRRLEAGGYRCVSQVSERGEFAVRGSLIDLYPMGAERPYRIDLFDDDIEAIRLFDPESQRTTERVDAVRLLPAQEFPLTEDAIARFRQAYRAAFAVDAAKNPLYRAVSQGHYAPGLEFYLPLFFAHTATLFQYLPVHTRVLITPGVDAAATHYWDEIDARYAQGRHNLERPLLAPPQLYLNPDELHQALDLYPHADLAHETDDAAAIHFDTAAPPALSAGARDAPGSALARFIREFPGRVLIAAESLGRRELLVELLRGEGLQAIQVDSWRAFCSDAMPLAITLAPLEAGLHLPAHGLSVVAESQLYGPRAAQKRRRERQRRDPEHVLRGLSELALGAPVVHEDHGVGRYHGLERLTAGGIEGEFVTLEYQDGDRLYVPVSALHLISRYTGAAPEEAPLHRLGGEQWQRARRRAGERIRVVAAELLEIYARRAARPGTATPFDPADYAAFAAGFPFEETPDQETAIQSVLADLGAARAMDRVVCGDVGFGKTEVALRAAFVAVQGGHQVALLVPTTLLAEQHGETFRDRFAAWPVRIEVLSRFSNKKQTGPIIAGLAAGTVDIVIGTHKLLSPAVHFKNLGLVVLDEEHRFGVRHKERLKALRAEVDVLTLTATPIPRTLNLALAGLRDLSIIATPPAHRLAVKTLITGWDTTLIREACLRELHRGGQIYFVHNEIESIQRIARELTDLVPEASVAVAHGQMAERELERVMLDFYHRRFNLLVCTTIIESGIDIPTANTILIHRADRLGLAQLHQLRGRVGRSHHRAYAYLIVPPKGLMTADAEKRLEAITASEELGAGFLLATHDLEIRGAGELLGEAQSGQIHEIGFNLYHELLQRAVASLARGEHFDPAAPTHHGPELDLGVPALIPDDYLPDVHARLILYKRIANAKNTEELAGLEVEMIDRFGLLPDPVKNLFHVTALKLQADAIGIRRIDCGPQGGRMVFAADAKVAPATLIELLQSDPKHLRFNGKETLRFTRECPAAQDRYTCIETLLDRLGANPATRRATLSKAHAS